MTRTDLGIISGAKPRPSRKRLVRLQVEEVEGLLARARHPRNRVTVSQCKSQLHIYLWEMGSSLELLKK